MDVQSGLAARVSGVPAVYAVLAATLSTESNYFAAHTYGIKYYYMKHQSGQYYVLEV
jgi:hypothetical protein